MVFASCPDDNRPAADLDEMDPTRVASKDRVGSSAVSDRSRVDEHDWLVSIGVGSRHNSSSL